MIFYSYSAAAAGLGLIYFSSKFTLIVGVILLALSFASLRIVTLALPGDIATGHNLPFLNGLFWMIQSIATLIALFISRFIQTEGAYLISLGILIVSFFILTSVFHWDFSLRRFAKIKSTLAKEIK